MKRVAFLLGAGSSIPAGYMSTACLTSRIQAPTGYSLDTDKRFRAGDQPLNMDAETPLVRRIIRWLSNRTREYFLRRPEAKAINYEDLYYLASQLADDATELQNPALLPFIDQLARDMTLWPEYFQYCDHKRVEWGFPTPTTFHMLCTRVCHYIEDIVIDVLRRQANCCQHLKLISAVSQADDLDLKGIATLAHDTHVETYLRSMEIKLADGFSDCATNCGWRVWKNLFPARGFVPFVKLHGSVSWKRLHSNGHGDAPLFTVGIHGGVELPSGPTSPQGSGPERAVYSHDSFNRTLLLIGTFNKPAQYARTMMLDIHYRFRKILEESKTLVICGYSFGDKAINTHLINWHRPRGRSLVVIDPCHQHVIIKTARYAARNILNNATSFITKPMEEVCPNQFMDMLRTL